MDGANYTDFVSRVRLEKAKNLLLNPQYRISEIAFEVGFKVPAGSRNRVRQQPAYGVNTP
jgi:AraC-like DNA-binding protein